MISYPWDSIVEAIGDDGFPIYDRDYKAADLQSLNGRIFSNGVFMDEPDAFVVTPAEGMNVILSAGWCCINGTFGNEPNMRELAIQSSASTQDRIDTVVLRWNANIEMRNIDVYVKTGVASDVPVRPQLTRDSTVYEIGIADIFVARGSGAISAARITDTRLQTDRCGAVTPFMQIDTTTFFNQIQAAIDERTAELEEQTAKAVELAQSAIDGTTAGNLQSQIDANKATDDERWESLSQWTNVTLASVWNSLANSARLSSDKKQLILNLGGYFNKENISSVFKLVPSINKKAVVIADLSPYLETLPSSPVVVGSIMQVESSPVGNVTSTSVFYVYVSSEGLLYFKADLSPTDNPVDWVPANGDLKFFATSSVCILQF